jgi:hypothetical protein
MLLEDGYIFIKNSSRLKAWRKAVGVDFVLELKRAHEILRHALLSFYLRIPQVKQSQVYFLIERNAFKFQIKNLLFLFDDYLV